MTDIENRVSRLEGEMSGMKGVADALFRLSDQMHTDMLGMRQELKAEIGALRTEVKAELGTLRTELKTDILGLRTELKTDIGGAH